LPDSFSQKNKEAQMNSFAAFFKSVFEALKNLFSLLFLRLFLWIPGLYALVFFIASRVYGFTFGDYAPYLTVAIILCFMLSCLLAFRSYYKKKHFPEESRKKERRRISDERVLISSSGGTAQNESGPEKETQKARLFVQKDRDGGFVAAPADDAGSLLTSKSDAQAISTSVPGNPAVGKDGLSASGAANIPEKSFSESLRRPSPEPTADTPRYLRTRRDPALLLLEYSDRLEVYRKTITGLEYLTTEYKQGLS
jgi:hypothetical protein